MLSRRLLTFSRWNKVPISVKPVKNNLLSAAKVEPKYTGSINPIIPSDTGSLEEVKIDWILPRDEKDTSSGSLYQIVANDPKYSGSANLILPSDMGSHVSPNLILSSDKVSLEEEKINWILPKDEKDTSSGSDWLMPFLTIGAGAVVIGDSSDEEDGKPGRLFNERLCMPHLFEKKQKEMEEEWIRKEQQAQQALDKKLKEMEQEWIRKEQQAQQALDKKLEENQRMFEKKQMKKKQEIREGSSISSVTHSFEGMNFNVKFKLEIENYSDQHFTPHQWKVHTGLVSSPHVPVKPGMKEAMSGHKTGYTATGCVGTVSWKIGDTNKMLVVMYSVSYDHNLHSNWLGVGIFNLADTGNHYNIMYYETERFFKRKEFYHNVDPVVYQDANYLVTANMGTSHQTIIQVQLFPQKIKHHEL